MIAQYLYIMYIVYTRIDIFFITDPSLCRICIFGKLFLKEIVVSDWTQNIPMFLEFYSGNLYANNYFNVIVNKVQNCVLLMILKKNIIHFACQDFKIDVLVY